MQLPSREPYFILPAKKQPLLKLPQVGFQGAPLLTGALVLVLIVIMVLVALSLGALWDRLTTGVNFPHATQESLVSSVDLVV
jgi:hypothetical protein